MMVDMEKPVQIMVNGKILYNQKLEFDKEFMIKNFKKKFDRKQVWVNKINIVLK